MPQKQVRWRFDLHLLKRFNEVYRSCNFKPSKVVEHFMKEVVKAKDPSIVL